MRREEQLDNYERTIARQEIEIKLLRDAIDRSNTALEEAVKTKEERDRLLLEVDELRRWVKEYGHHDSGCAAHSNQKRTSCEGHCDCGWAEIKEKYIEKRSDEKPAPLLVMGGVEYPENVVRVDEQGRVLYVCKKCGTEEAGEKRKDDSNASCEQCRKPTGSAAVLCPTCCERI